MQTDSITRVLLALILLTLLLLVGQGMGLLGGSGANRAGADTNRARYQLMIFPQRQGGPLAIRIDSHTGTVSRKALTGDGPWVIVDRETREGVGGAEEDASDQPPGAASLPVPADAPLTSPRAEAEPLAAQRAEPEGEAEVAAAADSPDETRDREARVRARGLYAALKAEAEARGIETEKPQDLSPLIRLASDPGQQPVIQEVALSHIVSFDPSSSVPALVVLLDHPRDAFVFKVMRQLRKTGDPGAIAPLRDLAQHHANPKVRARAGEIADALEAATP